MGQHGGHCRNRPGSPFVVQLAIDGIGYGPFLEGDDDAVRHLVDQIGADIDEVTADPRRIKGDVVFGDYLPFGTDLADQGEQRAVFRQKLR